MPKYRRARIPGGTYFFTVVTYHRQRFLANPLCQSVLSTVIKEVRADLPFTQNAWVYLPDHLHCIWTLPEGETDYSKRWGLIKSRFSKQVKNILKEEIVGLLRVGISGKRVFGNGDSGNIAFAMKMIIGGIWTIFTTILSNMDWSDECRIGRSRHFISM